MELVELSAWSCMGLHGPRSMQGHPHRMAGTPQCARRPTNCQALHSEACRGMRACCSFPASLAFCGTEIQAMSAAPSPSSHFMQFHFKKAEVAVWATKRHHPTPSPSHLVVVVAWHGQLNLSMVEGCVVVCEACRARGCASTAGGRQAPGRLLHLQLALHGRCCTRCTLCHNARGRAPTLHLGPVGSRSGAAAGVIKAILAAPCAWLHRGEGG